MVLPACISINSNGEPEPFEDENVAFIEIGETTKTEVEAELPLPMKSQDGDSWLYAKSRGELHWEMILVAPDTGAETVRYGTTDYRYLLVRFDENDVVTELVSSRSENPSGCNRAGVCVTQHIYMFPASEEQDRAAKLFDVPRNRCGVFVLGNPKTPIYIRLDGTSVGALFGNRWYILRQLIPGERLLDAFIPGTGNYERVDFSCSPGSLVFFQITTKRHGVLWGQIKVEVAKLGETDGYEAVTGRALTRHVIK